jgi:predicted HNH restriction endonuclease
MQVRIIKNFPNIGGELLKYKQDIAKTNTIANQNTNLDNFFSQFQTMFEDILKKTNEIQDNLIKHKNEIDSAFNEIDLELKNNQSLLEKWFSGENNALKRQQISQKKIWLLESYKTIHDKINQVFLDIEDRINRFNNESRQVLLNYKNMENKIEEHKRDRQEVFYNNNVYDPQMESIDNLNRVLQQAVDSLNKVQSGMAQSKLFEEIQKNIDNLIH